MLYFNSVGNSSSNTKAASQSETLLIGSGPLPARAPPEKKPVTTQPSEVPKVASQPASVSSAPAAAVSLPQPVKAPKPAPVPAPVPPPTKPVVSSASLPKLTQPMPLASRMALPNIARNVAAAFLEQEDDETETADVKTLTGISASGITVPQNYAAAKKVEANRPTTSKRPAPVPPPSVTSVAATASKSATTTKSDFMMGLSGMTYSDMVLAAQTQKTVSGLPHDRGDSKGLNDHSKARSAESNQQSATKSSYSSRQPTDSKGRKKLEIGRNIM